MPLRKLILKCDKTMQNQHYSIKMHQICDVLISKIVGKSMVNEKWHNTSVLHLFCIKPLKLSLVISSTFCFRGGELTWYSIQTDTKFVMLLFSIWFAHNDMTATKQRLTKLYTYFWDHSVYAPSQWEMVLQCNAISHWLGAYTEWRLIFHGTYCNYKICCQNPRNDEYTIFSPVTHITGSSVAFLWRHISMY